VSCQGSSVGLTSATPFDGYSFNVQGAGPSVVIVTFTGHGQALTIRAHCDNGQASGGGRDE
jgi:hypothetical protein